MTDEKRTVEDVQNALDDEAITDGMLRWEPGSLTTTIVDRILTDALSDLWLDCYRRGAAQGGTEYQGMLFRMKVQAAIYHATGEYMVIAS